MLKLGETTAVALPKPEWLSQERFWHSYRWFLKNRFGGVVYRASIDAGFTCPNVDGTVARGGCVYCDSRSFTPIDRRAYRRVEEQIQRQMEVLGRRQVKGTYLAYFQAATNTYATVEQLREMWEAGPGTCRIWGSCGVRDRNCGIQKDSLFFLQKSVSQPVKLPFIPAFFMYEPFNPFVGCLVSCFVCLLAGTADEFIKILIYRFPSAPAYSLVPGNLINFL